MDMIHDKETVCLAQTIEGEARGEGDKGMLAVATVIMNRVKDGRFGKGICGVVRARGQFSGYRGHIKPSAKALRSAVQAISGVLATQVGGRLYFNTVGPGRAIKVGNHYFW